MVWGRGSGRKRGWRGMFARGRLSAKMNLKEAHIKGTNTSRRLKQNGEWGPISPSVGLCYFVNIMVHNWRMGYFQPNSDKTGHVAHSSNCEMVARICLQTSLAKQLHSNRTYWYLNWGKQMLETLNGWRLFSLS